MSEKSDWLVIIERLGQRDTAAEESDVCGEILAALFFPNEKGVALFAH